MLRQASRLLSVFLLVFSAAAEDVESIWRDWADWIRQAPDYQKARSAYRERLVASGLTPVQADERLATIQRYAAEHRDESWRLHFNRLYSTGTGAFTREPNAFLARTVEGLAPGTALEVSMGEGRNGVYLATKGWKVSGFDPAEEGLTVARRNAQKLGVSINAVNATYETFDFGRDRWDLIFFCYAFAPLSDPELVARVRTALKPGGLVLFEHPMGDPQQPEHPHDRFNALLKAFADFRILFYEDTTGISDWQQSSVDRLRDHRRIVRLLARKP